jgi:hypothetical protein
MGLAARTGSPAVARAIARGTACALVGGMPSPRRTPPKPPSKIASEFCRAHLGRHAFAPLTGTDWRAWHAFVHLLELWGVSRDPRALDAMRSTIACAQTRHEDVMQIFVQTIPAMLDWSDVAALWPKIAPAELAHYRAVQS